MDSSNFEIFGFPGSLVNSMVLPARWQQSTSAGLSLLFESALVPAMQQCTFEQSERKENGDYQHGKQSQRGKHPGDLEPVARLNDAPGEPGGVSAGCAAGWR